MSVAYRVNGDLWVGTQHGLFLYKRSSSRWTYWNHPPPDLRNSVNEILRTRGGEIWIATSEGIEIHRTSGRIDQLTTINGVPLYVVTGLAEDADGNIWISSGASFFGAFRWNGSRWDHYPVSDDTAGTRFHKIRVDRRGRVWFLGIGKVFPPLDDPQPGAFLLENGRFRSWGKQEGLLNGRVYAFGDGADGTLWFGTFAGLSRWKNGEWTHWSAKDGLHTGRVFTLAVDRENRPWFGNYGDQSGLGVVDNNDSIQYFTAADGLVNDRVWDIKFDEEGTMWVATSGGLSSYAHGVWSTYNEKSGLQHVSLWPVLPLDNKIYVGTTGRGVAILHKEESTAPNPRIILEKPLMEGKNVILRWKAFAYWGELLPEEILTRVRINDGAWMPWQKKNEIMLPDQSPGMYTYEVQAKGVFGNFGTEGAHGSFSVPLPLLLRPLFLLPVGALGLTVVALGLVLLVRKRRHGVALRKSEAKFRAVAEMTLSAIFIYQGERLLFVNPGAEKLTGYPQADLYRMKLWEFIHPDHRETMQEWETNRHGDTTIPHHAELRFITKQGNERWVDFTWGWIKFQDNPATLASAFDITERKLGEEKLRSLASELSSTEERERRRLATYLHDTIGQTLAFCKMKIRLLQRSLPQEDVEPKLQEIRELVEQSITDTRSLTYELSPPVLYELSFVAAMEWLVNQLAQRHQLIITLEDDKGPKQFSDELRVFLFHAVREILINVAKHAEARRVAVSLHNTGAKVKVVVQDDGVGFRFPVGELAASLTGGFGLFNVRERLRHFGGDFEIESTPGKGTRVSLIAPMCMPEGD
jgi:PAS domain S-box-containing protein